MEHFYIKPSYKNHSKYNKINQPYFFPQFLRWMCKSSPRERGSINRVGWKKPVILTEQNMLLNSWKFRLFEQILCNTICAVLTFDPQLKKILTFSVKDRYQLNYSICIKDSNVETITSLKLNCFLSLFAAVSPIGSSQSRDLADENNKILTEWKWFETTVTEKYRVNKISSSVLRFSKINNVTCLNPRMLLKLINTYKPFLSM
jgi:hypothetical protein